MHSSWESRGWAGGPWVFLAKFFWGGYLGCKKIKIFFLFYSISMWQFSGLTPPPPPPCASQILSRTLQMCWKQITSKKMFVNYHLKLKIILARCKMYSCGRIKNQVNVKRIMWSKSNKTYLYSLNLLFHTLTPRTLAGLRSRWRMCWGWRR